MDKKLVGWMHPEGSSQWLRVPKDSQIHCTFSKFAHDTKLGGVVDTPEEQDVIQGIPGQTQEVVLWESHGV